MKDKLTNGKTMILVIGKYSSHMPESEIVSKYQAMTGEIIDNEEINRLLFVLEELKFIESAPYEYGKKYKLTKKGKQVYKEMIANKEL